MFKLSASQIHWFEFLFAMTEKEIKARYKHAVLGFLWIILNPLLQMLVIGLVFQFFVPVSVDNYFLFLFAGLLPWNFFAYSLTKTTPSIVYERSLIQKAKFPREAIVLSIVFSNLFHFLIALVLLLIALIGDKIIMEHYSIAELINYVFKMAPVFPAIIWLTTLTSGLSLLMSALNVRFRDINFVVQAIIPLWFYATPIVYTINLLPKSFHILVYLNPMTAIIEIMHLALLNQQPADMSLWWVSLVVSVLSILLGLWFFKKESPFFDDWI